MFESLKLKKQILERKKMIEDLEQRRMRSQGAILEAMLLHKDPNGADAEYFKKYTARIAQLREEIRDLIQQLSEQ